MSGGRSLYSKNISLGQALAHGIIKKQLRNFLRERRYLYAEKHSPHSFPRPVRCRGQSGAGGGIQQCRRDRLIRCDGHGVPEVLEAVLQLLPLDDFVDHPATLMKVVPGKFDQTPPIWAEYRRILDASGEPYNDFEYMERYYFYESDKHAYAIVATSETSLFANIILKKGTVRL